MNWNKDSLIKGILWKLKLKIINKKPYLDSILKSNKWKNTNIIELYNKNIILNKLIIIFLIKINLKKWYF